MLKSKNTKKEEDEVTIKGNKILAVSPEGQRVSMDLKKMVRIIAQSYGMELDTRCVLPDGVKAVISRGNVTIWVYERPPQPYILKWIADDSPAPFGTKTKYTNYRISLPYLVVIAVFIFSKRGGIGLSHQNECFFRTSPLKSMEDEMNYPALLNCSKFEPPEGHPLSWICTANMDVAHLAKEPDESQRMRASLRALLHCLLETGYNYSSEHHEASSWYRETIRAEVDPRISGGMPVWEEASLQDSLFVLDVPWLSTGMTLRDIIERIFKNTHTRRPRLASAADMKRVLFNHA